MRIRFWRKPALRHPNHTAIALGEFDSNGILSQYGISASESASALSTGMTTVVASGHTRIGPAADH